MFGFYLGDLDLLPHSYNIAKAALYFMWVVVFIKDRWNNGLWGCCCYRGRQHWRDSCSSCCCCCCFIGCCCCYFVNQRIFISWKGNDKTSSDKFEKQWLSRAVLSEIMKSTKDNNFKCTRAGRLEVWPDLAKIHHLGIISNDFGKC